MPAEPRRTSRKLVSEEDIELKRARGEISCAECRRLKLKCDKKLPCGSCVRRGCTTICPNGSLSAGQGTRFILADTDQLHRKISEMSERIRQLEDALAIFQSGVSSERHPLLRDDLLSIKFGPEVRRTLDEEASRNKLATSIDALGTLTIGEHGETKFIGRSGGSETLFLTVGPQVAEKLGADLSDDSDETVAPILEDDLENMSITFPLTIVQDGTDDLLRRLERELPPQPRAWALCEAYFTHFSWWFRPLKRDELVNEILSPIYKTVSDPMNQGGYHPNSGCGARCPHLLAVPEAEKYYRLGRAALSLRSILDSPEFETVQAITLMASYHSLSGPRYSTESAWSLVSLACKLSQALGLHRDSARWGLDPKTVDRRRNLFWETFIFEAVHCMALGRPPAASRLHIDCELPADEEQTLGKDGQPIEGFWHWKLHFTQSIIVPLHDVLLNAEPPNYEAILDLDRKIRQLSVPKVKLYPKSDEEEYGDAALCMQGCLMSQLRSIAMLAIHRTFFAQALLDHPGNPLRSPYAPSFLAANRCASVLVKSFLHHCERFPSLCGRFWSLWTHAFTACVILGSTVSRCPSATMAPNALIELDLAVELFKKGSEHSRRARQALPMLLLLKGKATRAYQQFRNRHISPSLDVQLHLGPEDQETEDRLAIFGGRTRVMTSKLLSKKPPKIKKARAGSPPYDSADSPQSDMRDYSSASPEATPTSSDSSVPQSVQDAFSEVHPALLDYLSLFPSSIALVDTSRAAVDTSSPPPSSTTSPTISTFASPYSQTTQTSFPPLMEDQVNFISSQAGTAYSSPTDSQFQNHCFPAPADRMSDPVAWYASLASVGSNMTGFPTVENVQFGAEHALMDEQWMNLMRDAGLFEQPSASVGTARNPGVASTVVSGQQHSSTLLSIADHAMIY